MITHHPEADLLLAYAAGESPEAMSLVIATHAALCPHCREIIKLGESIGGALLEDLPPEPVGISAMLERLDGLLSQPEATAPAKASGKRSAKDVPEPLYAYLAANLDMVRWRSVAPGLSVWPILKGECSAQLLRAKAGHSIGTHWHRGEEFSLVLAGGFTDSTGHYLRGDFQAADTLLAHRPIADEGKPCVILSVTNAPLVFRNPIIGLLAKLMGQ